MLKIRLHQVVMMDVTVMLVVVEVAVRVVLKMKTYRVRHSE
jgi:hypothetical protein